MEGPGGAPHLCRLGDGAQGPHGGWGAGAPWGLGPCSSTVPQRGTVFSRACPARDPLRYVIKEFAIR